MGLSRHIPNTITLLNLVSGVFGIIYAAKGDIGCAFVLMLAAALFDVLDGAAARGLKAYSAIGKELDSLADLVSFGTLPALMLFYMMQKNFIGPLWFTYLPLLFVPCAALRLAKFNIDETQAHGFKGLPVPAAAMFIGSVAAIMDLYEIGWIHNLMARSFIAMPAIIYIACRLMLSRIPMASLKSFSKVSATQCNGAQCNGTQGEAGSSGQQPYGSRAALIAIFATPIVAGIAVLLSFLADGFLHALAGGICTFSAAYIIINTVAGGIARYRKQ